MGYTGGATPPTAEEAAIYGRDLFHDGDLRVAADGDYQIVEGAENYRRAILRRLVVRPGEYRAKPNYGAGLPSFVKKKFDSTTRAEITARVTEQALLDRRTEKVISVEVTRETFNDTPILRVKLTVQAFSRVVQFLPFVFGREGV